jgi:hypothetical protein
VEAFAHDEMPRPYTTASHTSPCPACHAPICEGDEIALDKPKPEGQWMHNVCAEKTPWPGEDPDE